MLSSRRPEGRQYLASGRTGTTARSTRLRVDSFSFSNSLAESIVKRFNIDLELLFNYPLRLGRIVFRVVPQPWVGAGVRKRFAYPELFRDYGPVFLQTLESADEIRQHPAVGIDKPIKLVAMRRGMDAGAATVLNPADKFFKAQLLLQLDRFVTFIKRNNTVPWIANEPELEVALELSPPPFLSQLSR